MTYRAISIAALCAAATLASACGGSEETRDFEFNAIGKGSEPIYAMIGEQTQAPEAWAAAAKKQCEGEQGCIVVGFIDAKQAPTAFPMLTREAKAQAFHYSLNRRTGSEQTLFKCSVFTQKKGKGDECMAEYTDEEWNEMDEE